MADKCKLKVFEKANRILESINSYMRCNLLHINIKKCCYMHFTPKQKDIVVDDDNAINIVLGQNKMGGGSTSFYLIRAAKKGKIGMR